MILLRPCPWQQLDPCVTSGLQIRTRRLSSGLKNLLHLSIDALYLISHSCCAGLADRVVRVNVAESLPTIEYGQSIRGHERGGDELAIHARPELALLPTCMESLAHVQHLRILGALWAELMQIGPVAGPHLGADSVQHCV
jgi:hypothetical protein